MAATQRLGTGRSSEFDDAGAGASPAASDATGGGSTGSVAHVLVPGLTITPGAGSYLVWYTGMFSTTVAGAGARQCAVQIFANAVAQGVETISIIDETNPRTFARYAKVTVADGQAIEGRFRTANAASAAIVGQGVLAVSKVT